MQQPRRSSTDATQVQRDRTMVRKPRSFNPHGAVHNLKNEQQLQSHTRKAVVGLSPHNLLLAPALRRLVSMYSVCFGDSAAMHVGCCSLLILILSTILKHARHQSLCTPARIINEPLRLVRLLGFRHDVSGALGWSHVRSELEHPAPWHHCHCFTFPWRKA